MFWAIKSLQLTQLTLVTPLFALKKHLSNVVVFLAREGAAHPLELGFVLAPH